MDSIEKNENAMENIEVNTIAHSSKPSDKNHMKIQRENIKKILGTEKIVFKYRH